jgi:hypothetical protein
MRSFRSQTLRAAPYSAIEKSSPTVTAATATACAPFQAAAATSRQLAAAKIFAAVMPISGTIARMAQVNARAARTV